MSKTQEEKLKKSVDNSESFENLNKNMKSNRGGARPGAGRKPNKERARIKRMINKISKHGLGREVLNGKKTARIEILLTALFREGVKGNVSAIREYFDRQLGKSKERVELSNEEGKVFNINISTVEDDGDKLETNKKAK